jgi:hypothetical protein
MAKVPVTSGGLTEDQAIAAGTMLREGWDILRSLQFNKKASVLRYTEANDGKPELGIPPTRTLVTGLSNLDVYWSRVSTREVIASRGLIELTDVMFIFYAEARSTDEILFDGKTYKVVSIKFWNPDIGRTGVIARAV